MEGASVVHLPPGGRLITWGLMPCWAFSVGVCCWHIEHLAVAIARSALLSRSPCVSSTPATMAILLMSPLGGSGVDWRKRLTGIHRTDHPIYLIIKVLLCWGHPLVKIHMGHKCLHIFSPLRAVYSHTSSKYCCQPGFLVTNFSIMFLSSPWPSSQTAGFNWYKSTHLVFNWYESTCLVISPALSEHTGVLLKALAPGKIALHHCSSGMF